MICKCPGNASLPDIPKVVCNESFGQIQKVAFQRLMKADGSKNKISKETITQLSAWTPLLIAADDTKVVVSPYIEAPTTEAGAPRTFGGGNETLGGIETIIGREPTTFTGQLRQLPQTVIKAMKELQCESLGGNLGVYLFDGSGAMECIVDSEDNCSPIPVRSLFIGDKTHGGFDSPDSNQIQWSFLPNYSDDLAIVQPEFNPLTDLVVGVND
ncbi:MAG: hypothetical protein J6J14_02000 [Rikenellaceae bacterium]|nr:hypothetical protein [Rikenellaceae bacterium]